MDVLKAQGRASVSSAGAARLSNGLVILQMAGVAAVGGSPWTPVDQGLRMADPGRRLAFNMITPGWFAAYGTTIRAGRDFTARDSAASPAVVILDQGAARALMPGQSPIDRVTTCPGPSGSIPCTVVGVVEDAVLDTQRQGMEPVAYLPLAQSAHFIARGMTEIGLSVRPAAGAPMQLRRGIADALTAVDPAA